MSDRSMNVGELIRNANRLKREGKLDEAIAEYRRVIELNPNFAWAYSNLGDALVKQGKLNEAINAFSEAIQLNPKSPCFHYALAEAMEQNNQLDEAISTLFKALEYSPNYYIFYNSLGKLLTQQSEIDEAVIFFKKAINLNPSSHQIYRTLTDILDHQQSLFSRKVTIHGDLQLPENNLRLINQLKSSKHSEKFNTINNYLREDKYFIHFNKYHQMKNSIFITARYRTGSTYLYSLFSSLVDVAAFYEPLNEEVINWLDKDEKSTQENQTVFAHTLKDNYFGEYKSLNIEKLRQAHSREFGTKKMVMSKKDYYYQLKNYISFILSSYPTKLNVLQFNRIDFRLAWFKVNFPQALIVNLRRNPRDIYVSYIETHLRANQKTSFDFDYDLGGMFCLDFYIKLLGSISIPQFCIYELNNYEKIYVVNQLSNLWADKFADVVVTYESLINNPIDILSKIVSHIPNYELKLLEEIVEPKKTRINLWSKYHPDSWFQECEEKCDHLLKQILYYSEM